VQVIRGFVLAVALCAAAPLVGWFFDEPRAVKLVRVMSLMTVVEGLGNIGIIYFKKELQFHRQFMYDVVAGVVSLAIGVILAYLLRSVWALAWSGLAGAVARCGASYFLHPYRPRLRVDWDQAGELFGFGGWILGSAVITFVVTNGDDAFVGKLFGAASLGIYQIGYRLSHTVATHIKGTITTVVLPTYAKIQDEPARLRRAYNRVLRGLLMLCVPLAAFIAFFAPELIRYTVGSNWVAAVPLLPLLAAGALLRSITATGGPLYMGTGRPEYAFWSNVARLVALAVTILPLARLWGLPGVCVSALISQAAPLPLWVVLTGKVLRQKPAQCLAALGEPALAAVLLLAPSVLSTALWGRHLGVLVPSVVLGMALVGGFVLLRASDELRRLAGRLFR
jgi:O-antigen/teichoic acid export membrane protein